MGRNENIKDDDNIIHDPTTINIDTLDNNITRIIYCYTIIHLNTTTSNNIQKYVNESIVHSFISILTHMQQQHTDTSNTSSVKKNEDDKLDKMLNGNDNIFISNDWKIVNITSQ